MLQDRSGPLLDYGSIDGRQQQSKNEFHFLCGRCTGTVEVRLTFPHYVPSTDQSELQAAVQSTFLNPTAGDRNLLLPHRDVKHGEHRRFTCRRIHTNQQLCWKQRPVSIGQMFLVLGVKTLNISKGNVRIQRRRLHGKKYDSRLQRVEPHRCRQVGFVQQNIPTIASSTSTSCYVLLSQ